MVNFMDKWKDVITETAKIVSEKGGEVVGAVANKTGDVVEVVINKTEQTVEIQKIKSQVRVMKRNNDRDFKDIGKMIYHKYKKGEEIDEQYVELCESIEEREGCIEKSQVEIAKIKGETVCPNCNTPLADGASYCQKCGMEL